MADYPPVNSDLSELKSLEQIYQSASLTSGTFNLASGKKFSDYIFIYVIYQMGGATLNRLYVSGNLSTYEYAGLPNAWTTPTQINIPIGGRFSYISDTSFMYEGVATIEGMSNGVAFIYGVMKK